MPPLDGSDEPMCQALHEPCTPVGATPGAHEWLQGTPSVQVPKRARRDELDPTALDSQDQPGEGNLPAQS
eukprot:2398095-Amphidinium_carterae.1